MMSPVRQQISHAKTLLYRKPKDEFLRMRRWGPRAYFRIEVWKHEMEEAACQLPKVESGNKESPPVSLWFLTGKRFWYQTMFCAWTFAKHSEREVVLNLVDDGTLGTEHEDCLRRLFPSGVTLRKKTVRDRIETLLPIDRFPVLRQRWGDYINIRKLTDVHLGSSGVKLVLDSDMLFFRRPDALLEWWDGCQKSAIREQRAESENPISDLRPPTSVVSSCLMTDCVESYGYSRPLMEELAGVPILPVLNVGICGLSSENLNWEELELWCRVLVEKEGTSYYLEQALVAMLASQGVPTVMSREDYITFPSKDEILEPTAVLQHYVADSKPGYFGRSWKLALEA